MNKEILLADDEVTFRDTLKQVLEEECMSVTAVGDGIERQHPAGRYAKIGY